MTISQIKASSIAQDTITSADMTAKIKKVKDDNPKP